MSYRRFRRSLLGAISTFLLVAHVLVTPSAAQDFPSRPITLIVPFPAGGSLSVMARIVGAKMSELLSVQIVIENRVGAGGTVATRSVAKMTPDGYSILLGYSGTLGVAPTLYANVGYDPRKDFAPIGMIGSAPSVLVVNTKVQANSVAELIALAKKSNPPLQYGTPGLGTVNHLSTELFASMTGIKLVHIPYKGAGPAINDLLGGHIQLSFSPIPAARGNIEGGNLRALMVTSPKRLDLLPNVPGSSEAGLANFEGSLRYGLLAPAGTPRPIIDKLFAAVGKAMEDQKVRARMSDAGIFPVVSKSPEEFKEYLDRDRKKWSEAITEIGAKPE